MFRSLATRLTATYVFAAIVLVVAAVGAVMAFSLSTFAFGSRQAVDIVARQAPFEARFEIARAHSLRAAAKEIVQNLARPGLIIGVVERNGDRRSFLAGTDSTPGLDGRPIVFYPDRLHRGGPDFGPPPHGDRPFFRGPPPYPFGLSGPFHVEPRWVAIPGGAVHIAPDPAPFESTTRAFLAAMLPIGLVAVLAAWFLGRFITGQALRPLVETTASLNRFGAGDFTPHPVVTTDRNEIGELAKAYNAAAAQVTAAFEERRLAEAHMRQFIADAGHELRTPLTVIMGFIDVLRRRSLADASAGRAGETVISSKIYETMLAESRRMRALIDKLIVLARLENVRERDFETVDLGETAARVVASLQALDARPRIALRTERGAIVLGDGAELHDAISNLVENALKYAPDSPVEIHVRAEGDAAAVDVVDRGPGIPLDEQEKIFSRFYRGRDHGDAEGFGLGLAIAKRAVERAGGTLAVASVPGDGSAFMLRVPLAAHGEAVAVAV